ncbi:regulatory protein RecX [Halobacteriovorax marinus]|uniref:regulatory protein RecX n=1 Tax=Halobacteriovorax marinus TaxID=97084 RepID=UPI003A8E9BA5
MTQLQESSTKNAYLYIIKLLTKRDYSKYKLANKLKTRGFSSNHIEEAIQEVEDKGYLRENEYAMSKAKSLMLKNNHPNLIISKLSEENLFVSTQELDELFQEYRQTTRVQIETIIEKKLRTTKLTPDLDFFSPSIQKIIRHCLSKGHDLDEVKETFSNIKNLSR